MSIHSDLQGGVTTPPPPVTTPPPAERGPGTTSEGRQTVITCTHSTCTLHTEYFHCVCQLQEVVHDIIMYSVSCNSISLHHEPVISSCKVTCR